MAEVARWRGVFADGSVRHRWLAYARGWNERINAFVSFADAADGADAARTGRSAACRTARSEARRLRSRTTSRSPASR